MNGLNIERDEALRAIHEAVDQLEFDKIVALVHQGLELGIAPLDIIQQGVITGLGVVGDKFEDGSYFLGELILAGKTANEALAVLENQFSSPQNRSEGNVILATVEGDVHEIGKNLVGMLLKAYGFDVIDLGVDVPAAKILEAIQESGARLLGLSLLFSTMEKNLSEVIRLVKNTSFSGGDVRVAIGGACTSERLMKKLGADAYADNAMEAVKVFQRLKGSLS